MPEYVCEKCAKVFKQKSQMTAHEKRKTPCTKTTALNQVIAITVEKKVKEAVKKNLSSREPVTKENLQSFFEELHNILWSRAGLNPEKALEHMTFFFAYRMIELQADALNLPQVCRWSYIAALKDEEDLVNAIKEGLTAFRKNPKTKPFFKPHELQKAELVYDVVEQINRVTLHTLQDTDVLGDIFEYMLGRGMSTMSDQGQYFTNRAICRLAFKLAYAIKKTVRRPDGSLCTFADWFCGTGGFAAEYVKGVNQILGGQNPNWKKDSTSIYCQDMNLSSITTTLLNLLIVTGQPFGTERIRNGNTFADPITIGDGAPFKGLAVDYCFMNPPYGGSKFIYCKGKGAEKQYLVNQEIRSIGIEDDDKVSAGVQLAMATLSADGGVCAIVLPQGFFFGASKKIVELRKKIAEEYTIHYVVDIASGAFANTGTKTSMLVFQRGVGPTERVKFIGMDEKELVEAGLEELRAKNYSLNYKQYLAQDAVEVEGFEMVRLGDICHTKNGFAIKSENMTKNTSDYPIIKVKNLHDGTGRLIEDNDRVNIKLRDEFIVKRGDVLIVMVGNTAGKMAVWEDKDAYLNQNIHKIHFNEKVNPRYVYYILNSPSLMQQILPLSSGTAQPFISPTMLYEIKIPLPSLERQQQIIEAIDGWTILAQQEEQALKTLEKQVMFQVKEMGRGKERVKLGDILEKKSSGKTKVSEISNSGEYPFFSCKNENPCGTHSSFDHGESEYMLFAKSGGNAKQPTGDNLGIGRFYYMTHKSASTSDVSKFILKKSVSALMNYLDIVLKTKLYQIQSMARYTTGLGHIDIDEMLNDIQIPLPSLAEQQTLQSDFEEIRHKHAKITEYKAKAQEAIQRLIPGA